jgi:ribonuclease BN (tRNA processing enzyme)
VMPAVHSVPAVGYAVAKGAASWVFSGDTGHNPTFWQRVNQMEVSMLVIETTFSREEEALAIRSRHLSSDDLLTELKGLAIGKQFPIYITHTKPAETTLIMSQVHEKNTPEVYDIRWLSTGQTFEL